MKKFAVFDIDGTLIRWQLYHAITDALARRGHIKPGTYQVMREARLAWKRWAGGDFKDYERQVIGIYDEVISTLNFEQLDEAIGAVFTEYRDQVYTYTRDLIKDLKGKGYKLFAISGSQTEILAKIAGYYGFDDYVGSVYERDGATFTGKKTIGSRKKDEKLQQLIKKNEVDLKGSIAIGDSHSDIPMLEMAEQPIAFNPEQELYVYAKAQGWKIVIERKNVIYELSEDDGKYSLA